MGIKKFDYLSQKLNFTSAYPSIFSIEYFANIFHKGHNNMLGVVTFVRAEFDKLSQLPV
jgi:hypothetical protein